MDFFLQTKGVKKIQLMAGARLLIKTFHFKTVKQQVSFF